MALGKVPEVELEIFALEIVAQVDGKISDWVEIGVSQFACDGDTE